MKESEKNRIGLAAFVDKKNVANEEVKNEVLSNKP